MNIVNHFLEIKIRYCDFICFEQNDGYNFYPFSSCELCKDSKLYYDRKNYNIKKIIYNDDFFNGEEDFVKNLYDMEL